MGTAGIRWCIVMSCNAGFSDQVLLFICILFSATETSLSVITNLLNIVGGT